MKKIKKILAFVLAMVMVVATFSLASAIEKTSGQKLQELGIILGSDGGALLEDENLTREQAATIIVRVLVLDVDTTNLACKYVDVDTTWAAPYVNALIEANITVGISAAEFGKGNYITQFEFFVWLYRAINGGTPADLSTDVYNNSGLFVTSELLTEEEVATIQADDKAGKLATRGEIFDAIYKFLFKNKNIVEKEMTKYGFTQEKAIELGLIKVEEPAKSEIVAVEALNFAEIKVTWSGKASTDAACYKVNGKSVKVESVSDTEVILSFENIATDKNAPQATAEVEFDAEKDFTDDNKVDQKLTTNETFDTTAPSVVAVEQSGVNKFTVKFSEFVLNSTVAITLNNGMVAVSKVNTTEGYVKELQFEALGAGLTDKTAYTVKVAKDVTDVAALKMKTDATLTFTYAKVATPIEVTVKSATPEQIVLELSAPTTKTIAVGAIVPSNFSYIFSNKEPILVLLGDDDKTITLVLFNGMIGYKAPENADGWDLTIKNADQMFVDEWGNTTAEKEFTVKFFPAVDKVAPTVTKAELSKEQDKIIVAFDEAINTAKAPTITVKKGDTDVTSTVVTTPTPDSSDNDKTWSFDTDATAFDDATYTVIVKDAEDSSANKMAEYTTTVTAKTMRNVEIKKVEFITDGTNATKLYVEFNNEMNEAVLDKGNWVIEDSANTAAIKSLAFKAGSKNTVEIELDNTNDANKLADADSGLLITLANTVKDNNGNAFASPDDFSTEVTVGSTKIVELTGEAVWNKLDFQVVGPQEINLVIPKDVNIDLTTISTGTFAFSAINSENAIIATATIAAIAAPQQAADGTVTYEIHTTPFKNATSSTVYTFATDAKIDGEDVYADVLNDIKTTNGVIIQQNSEKVVTDKIAPRQTGDLDARYRTPSFSKEEFLIATVMFTEEIVDDAELYPFISSEIEVKYDGTVLLAGIDYNAMVNSNSIEIIMSDEITDATKKVEVSLPNASLYMKDAEGNPVQPFAISAN